ncbi:MAG: PTS fructose transporter subunit IIA [Desulfobacteraceae bacterium 4572_35.1]|nr:MAG: PTS fructose transporter subunit IIA [Desulfobacteraceae bacterium 4572_35.1]
MYTNVKEAARLLSVSEKTVYRWIKQELLPTYKVQGSYRFNRAELLGWASSRKIGVVEERFEEVDADTLPLPTVIEALEAGGVIYRIEGGNRDEALAEVVEDLRLPDEVERDALTQMLIARENMSSTAIGDGIAIPHPRNAAMAHVQRPKVTICFLEHPLDFSALDGKRVNILFIVLAPSLRAQLHLLSLLGFLLRDSELLEVLKAQMGREALFAAVRSAEKRFNTQSQD